MTVWPYFSNVVIVVCGAANLWLLWHFRHTHGDRSERANLYAFSAIVWGWLISSALGVDWPTWVEWTARVAGAALIMLFLVRTLWWIRSTRREMNRLMADFPPPPDEER